MWHICCKQTNGKTKKQTGKQPDKIEKCRQRYRQTGMGITNE